MQPSPLPLLQSSNPSIQALYTKLELRLAALRPAEASAFLALQIAGWEAREESFFVWAALGGATHQPHPFGGQIDAFDLSTILLDLRRAASRLAQAEA